MKWTASLGWLWSTSKAAGELTIAVNANPMCWEAHLWRGELSVMTWSGKNATKGMKELDLALTLAPAARRPKVLVIRAQSWVRARRNFPKALADIEAAIRLRPDDAHTWGAKASILREMGLPREAASAEQKANRLRRGTPSVRRP